MTRGDLPVMLWGRPVKPLALALTLTMLAILWVNVSDTGIFGTSWIGDGLAVLAAWSAATLIGGWVFRVQAMAEMGLLVAAGVWTVRGTAALVGSPGSLWVFSYCWALAAAGAYLLETADRGPLRSYRGG